MLALLGVVLLAAPAPTKVAVPTFTGTGVDAAGLTALTGRFVSLAGNERLRFITNADISAVLGLERQKTLLGCDSSDCMTELTNALGAELLVSGTLARVGDELLFSLRAVRAKDAGEVVSLSTRVKDLAALNDWFEKVSPGVGRKLAGLEARASRWSSSPWWLGGGGLVLAAGGAALFTASKFDKAILTDRRPGYTYSVVAQQGQLKESSGLGLMIGGGVLLAAGIVLWASGVTGDAQVALLPAPGGAAFAFGGRF